MRTHSILAAVLAVLASSAISLGAENGPTIRNNVITCPDGSQAQNFDPSGPPLDAEAMLTICRMNAALAAARPETDVPSQSTPELTTQEAEDALRRALGLPPKEAPTIRPLPGLNGYPGLGSDPLNIQPVPIRKFNLSRDDFNAAFALCSKGLSARSGAARVLPADIRPICACRMRAIQYNLTQGEFNRFLEWEIWRTTWRHYLWTVELPAGLREKLVLGSRACADERAA